MNPMRAFLSDCIHVRLSYIQHDADTDFLADYWSNYRKDQNISTGGRRKTYLFRLSGSLAEVW